MTILNNQSTLHAITKEDIFNKPIQQSESSVFSFEDRYSSNTFQGIMPDSGAAGVLTARKP